MSVFIDGERADDKVSVTVLDPGKGHLLSDWRELVDESARDASPAAGALIRELGEAWEDSEHVRSQ